MRLHVLSDLHLEHAPFAVPDVDVDVVVLAGDTAPGTVGIEWARQVFPADRPIIYLAGNHEFYGHSFPSLINELRAQAEGSNVTVLENDQLMIDGIRFLGCTLWTDFDTGGPERRAAAMRFAQRASNDYKLIGGPVSGTQLQAADTRERHLASRAWLTERLDEPYVDGPTVVITHYVPLIRRRSDNPVLQALGATVASDLAQLMGEDRVRLWIYGHNHRRADLDERGTRVISNPRGYPHEPVEGFDPGLVIEI